MSKAIIALGTLYILIVLAAGGVFLVNSKLIKETRYITEVDIPVTVEALEMIDVINDLFFDLYAYTNGDKAARATFYESSITFELHRDSLKEKIEKISNEIVTEDYNGLKSQLKFIDQYYNVLLKEAETEIFEAFDPKASEMHNHHKNFIQTELTNYVIEPLIATDSPLSGTAQSLELLQAALMMIKTLENPVLEKSEARETYFQNLQILKSRSTHICTKTISLNCENFTRKLAELNDMGEHHFEFEFTHSQIQTQHILGQFVTDYFIPLKSTTEDIALKTTKGLEADIEGLHSTLALILITILTAAFACIFIISLLFIFFWRRILAPIKQVSGILVGLGKSDKSFEIPRHRSRDEIGLIFRNLRTLKESLIELDKLKELELDTMKSAHNEQLEEAYNALKASEEELRLYSAKLETTNQELEQFIHIASHDFREPLKNISGYSQMLRAREKDARNLALIENISNCTNRAGILIDDLRALTKLHKIEAEPEILEIEPIFVQAFAEHKIDFENRKAKVNLSLSGDLECYEHYLRIVFDQTIGNAKHYGAKSLEFSAKTIETSDYLTIEITNNLDESIEYDSSLFLPFKRGQNANRDSSGVGLSVCRKIIEELHGGKIWIDTDKKEKDRFKLFIRLPRRLRQSQEIKRIA